MPSDKEHTERSESPNAMLIHTMLDHNPRMSHQKWRETSHEPLTAMIIGYAIDGKRGAMDAIRHVKDDMIVGMLSRELRKAKRKPKEE